MSTGKWQESNVHIGEYVCADCMKPLKQGVVMYWRKEVVCRECFIRIMYRRSKAYNRYAEWKPASKPSIIIN